MNKIVTVLICFALFFSSIIVGNTNFGYISYSSLNIGDDIQSIAAQSFLPKDSLAIDREFIHPFNHRSKIKTIINGWFMHTKDFIWYLKNVKAPEKSWPPSPDIEPLLISIHFAKRFIPIAFSEEGIDYLRKHGPVGARDYYTLKELQKRSIPSFFSGCLTLTLKNDRRKRNDTIYAVDLDNECENYLRSNTNSKVIRLTHTISEEMSLDHEKRLILTKKILDKYKKAKCVITTRLHASMPCLAYETPVLLINTQVDQYRFDGLRQLVRNCTKEEFLNGSFDFNFEEPTENPKFYIPIRENLIKRVTKWVKR